MGKLLPPRDPDSFVEQFQRAFVFEGVALGPTRRAEGETEGFGVAAPAGRQDQFSRAGSEGLWVADHFPIRCPHAYQ